LFRRFLSCCAELGEVAHTLPIRKISKTKGFEGAAGQH
jgi:hypothetical protein